MMEGTGIKDMGLGLLRLVVKSSELEVVSTPTLRFQVKKLSGPAHPSPYH